MSVGVGARQGPAVDRLYREARFACERERVEHLFARRTTTGPCDRAVPEAGYNRSLGTSTPNTGSG